MALSAESDALRKESETGKAEAEAKKAVAILHATLGFSSPPHDVNEGDKIVERMRSAVGTCEAEALEADAAATRHEQELGKCVSAKHASAESVRIATEVRLARDPPGGCRCRQCQLRRAFARATAAAEQGEGVAAGSAKGQGGTPRRRGRTRASKQSMLVPAAPYRPRPQAKEKQVSKLRPKREDGKREALAALCVRAVTGACSTAAVAFASEF